MIRARTHRERKKEREERRAHNFYFYSLHFVNQVPVQFEFIKKLDDTSYCKDWLHIEPYTGFIKPGINL